MKLYDVPRGSKIKLVEDPKTPPAHKHLNTGEVLRFAHLDGMYSYCTDADGNAVHIAGWTEVEVVE